MYCALHFQSAVPVHRGTHSQETILGWIGENKNSERSYFVCAPCLGQTGGARKAPICYDGAAVVGGVVAVASLRVANTHKTTACRLHYTPRHPTDPCPHPTKRKEYYHTYPTPHQHAPTTNITNNYSAWLAL